MKNTQLPSTIVLVVISLIYVTIGTYIFILSIKETNMISFLISGIFWTGFYESMIELRYRLYRAVRDGKSMNLIERKWK